MNALDANAMAEMVSRQKIDSIFNLVALLSAVGEAKPDVYKRQERRTYVAPELSIAEFAIENGFGNSVASFEEETYE